jgi:cytochrome bd-type quinol oxidase subunit 1
MEPWFDPNRCAWIPGTVFGCMALVLGALAGWLVPKGLAKRFMVSSWVILWLAAIALLIAGVVALFGRQPWGVWYGLLLPGFVGATVLGGNLLIILKRYREVEQRQRSQYPQ